MDNYEKMLNNAYDKMPPIVFETQRFEVPKLKVTIEGNKSVMTNFKEVVDYIRCNSDHLLKFIGRDMGAAWRKEGSRTIFVGKFGPSILNKKLEKYVKRFVLCPVCEKPDTKLKKVDRISIMKCSACGATSPVPQQ